MSLLRTATDSGSTATGSSDSRLLKCEGEGESKHYDRATHSAHLAQVEAEVARIFDGLGSPISNDADRQVAAQLHASLMFGEILFPGVTRIMDSAHLHAAAPGTRTLYDLGSGCGRLCVQVFLQFTNLERVVGVELTSMRSNVAFNAMKRMGACPPKGYERRTQLTVTERPTPTYTITVTPRSNPAPAFLPSSFASPATTSRVLELRQGNMFDCTDAWDSDILICETNIAVEMQYDFLHFLSHCKPGCRLLTYNNMEAMHDDVLTRMEIAVSPDKPAHERKVAEKLVKPPWTWQRLPINTYDDKFSASWGEVRFHLYTRLPNPNGAAAVAQGRARAKYITAAANILREEAKKSTGFTGQSDEEGLD